MERLLFVRVWSAVQRATMFVREKNHSRSCRDTCCQLSACSRSLYNTIQKSMREPQTLAALVHSCVGASEIRCPAGAFSSYNNIFFIFGPFQASVITVPCTYRTWTHFRCMLLLLLSVCCTTYTFRCMYYICMFSEQSSAVVDVIFKTCSRKIKKVGIRGFTSHPLSPFEKCQL